MFKKKKKSLYPGMSEDANFAAYSERVFSNDEGLKAKSHQTLVASLEDNVPFYLAEKVYFRCYQDTEQNVYVMEFYMEGLEDSNPYRVILNKEEFDSFFEYVIAVREDIYSDITLTKDSNIEINIGRNLRGMYWLNIVESQSIKVNLTNERTMFIKLVHALLYAKHYTR